MKLVWVVIPLVLIGIIGMHESFAFSECIEGECSIDKYANIVDIIFLGNVVSTEQNKVSFNAMKIWVGNVTESQTIRMACQNHNCESSFQIGKTYLILGYEKEPFNTLVNKWSKPILDAREDIQILNDPNFQTNHKNNLTLLEKLETIKDNQVTGLMGEFPITLVYVDKYNVELVVALTPPLTQDEIESYEEQLKEIVGDVPMRISFAYLEDQKDYVQLDVLQIERIFPPLKQIKNGVLPEKVECKIGLTLIFKSSDNSPACVKQKTAITLIQRGWAEKNESKIWVVVSALTQCADPWDRDKETIRMSLVDRITHYYEKHDMDIEIHDVVTKASLENDEKRCEGCDCSGGNLFLLVDESDVEFMLNSGFILAEGNNTKQAVSNKYKPMPLG